MTYSLLTIDGKVIDAMPQILVEAFNVQLSETDVSPSSELESRNWDALVTCEYEAVAGDLAWSLLVYAAREVEQHPTEEELAVLLSQRLEAPVFFAWGDDLPWIRKVALPGGEFTLARVTESDDERSSFAVEAAESIIPGFPTLPVTHFPEIVRALAIPTPVTDAAVKSMSGRGDGKLRGLLVNWERLSSRMRSGWPPAGWYSPTMYQEDLELRDLLAADVAHLGTRANSEITDCLSRLDAQYRDVTVDDRGRTLANALGHEKPDLVDRPWYWQRRPDPLPWTPQ
ncbi:hypothetical protein H9W91_11865 [Streptomyces alfalfae]|uniref:hypothetical protein n=1 Tax=Streptomyces alfalfae TaxID=1642299 RepID=UPI001BA62E8C|nr:hypothetical protein [Streptomyces alfalfae]QUI31488.1 hypothetical protein H9W91_11865 [Streptomyces alfalfae]